MPNASLPQRRSIRLPGYDYTQNGAYFVTVCAVGHTCLFGDIKQDTMYLNDWGDICGDAWIWLGQQYPYVTLDAWVIMPNHMHGILFIDDATPKRKPLGRLIGAFKTVSTKAINQDRDTPGTVVWQRNYYERVIRDENELNRIRQYITANPARWSEDEHFTTTTP